MSSDHCAHGTDIRNKCDECDRISALEGDAYIAERKLRAAEVKAIEVLVGMDAEKPLDIMPELAKVRSQIMVGRATLASARALVTAERDKAKPPWMKATRCGHCSSCWIETHGCGCDGALDDGCFNCNERKPRPACPACANCGQYIYEAAAPHSALLHVEGDAFYCDVAKLFASTPKPKCHICETETDRHGMFCSAAGAPRHRATVKPASR
jgi:hypothetical protein